MNTTGRTADSLLMLALQGGNVIARVTVSYTGD
jgi:hypothetical protein